MEKMYINFVDDEENFEINDCNDVATVKVYKNINNKKVRLKKAFFGTISIGLSIALVSSMVNYFINKENKYNGIDINKNDSYENQYSYNNETTHNYANDINAFEIINGEDPVINKNYPSIDVKLDYNQYNQYINYIKNLDSNYKFQDLYGISEAINRNKANNLNVKHEHDITNGSGILTSKILFNRVKINNENFFADQNKSIGYKKLKNSYIKNICDLLVESINAELSNNPKINKQDVFCILYDLKIMGKNVTFDNSAYNEDDILIVDEDNIENYQFFNKEVDAFRQVIYHEGMHIIQSACDDIEKESVFKQGICYIYDDLKVNPFYWSWFLDAVAEKEMGRILNEETNTYSAQIGYYDSLILCSILNDNVSVSDVEAISFEKQSGSLFKVFNATTNEEKLEIIKMMYSIEIMQSQPDDFYKIYKEAYGIDLLTDEESKENLRLELRIDILKTLSKEFYRSLSNQVLNGNLTLDTIYYLINVYEADVFIHLFYNEKARIASGVEFFDFYTELQDEFFRMLEPSLNYDFNEIVDMFNNYSMNVSYNGNVIKNYDLTSLGDDANFIEKKRIQNYQTGIPPIRSMPEYCKLNGYSK